MESTKIIILTVIGIVAVATSLTVTRLFMQASKAKHEEGGKINLAYAVLFTSWVVAFALINQQSLSILSEYIDTLYKTSVADSTTPIVKTSILFIGLTQLWLLFWHLVARGFSLIFTGKRVAANEIEANHYTLFLIRGIIFIAFIYIMMPAFEILLRYFLPAIEIPYYH